MMEKMIFKTRPNSFGIGLLLETIIGIGCLMYIIPGVRMVYYLIPFLLFGFLIALSLKWTIVLKEGLIFKKIWNKKFIEYSSIKKFEIKTEVFEPTHNGKPMMRNEGFSLKIYLENGKLIKRRSFNEYGLATVKVILEKRINEKRKNIFDNEKNLRRLIENTRWENERLKPSKFLLYLFLPLLLVLIYSALEKMLQ